MKILAITLLCFMISMPSFAAKTNPLKKLKHSKILVISDIDDTIKIARIRHKIERIRYAFKTKSEFIGMKQLYKAILREYNDTEIVYVTNAVAYMMEKSHTKFLNDNNFPEGEVFFRDSKQDKEHKVRTISRLLEDKNPDVVILFGDNAEHDISYYNEAIKNFKGTVLQYIRVVYNPSDFNGEVILPTSNQVGFITPVEVAKDLGKRGYLSEESEFNVIEKIANRVFKNQDNEKFKPQYIPKWANRISVSELLAIEQVKKAKLCQSLFNQ